METKISKKNPQHGHGGDLPERGGHDGVLPVRRLPLQLLHHPLQLWVFPEPIRVNSPIQTQIYTPWRPWLVFWRVA